MVHIQSREHARAIVMGQSANETMQSKSVYYGLIGQALDISMVESLSIKPAASFMELQRSAVYALQEQLIRPVVEQLESTQTTHEIIDAAAARYGASVALGRIRVPDITPQRILQKGVLSGTQEIAVTLATIHNFHNHGHSYDEQAVRRSVRVPIKHAMLHSVDQQALFEHRTTDAVSDITYRPESVSFDDHSGLRFIGKLALDPTKRQHMHDYFGGDPYDTNGPTIGCPVTFHSKFINHIYDAMTNTALESELLNSR